MGVANLCKRSVSQFNGNGYRLTAQEVVKYTTSICLQEPSQNC